MESKRTAITHFIPPGKFLLLENALGNPDLIQSSVTSDCRVTIVDRDNFPLDELEQWPTFRLTAADVKLKLGNGAYYIYIVVPTTDNTETTSAFISYHTSLVDRDGYAVVQSVDPDGNSITSQGELLGKPGFKYYQCGTVSARGGNPSVTTTPSGQGRVIEFDLGVTPAPSTLPGDLNDFDKIFHLEKVDPSNSKSWLLTILSTVKEMTARLVRITGSLVFGSGESEKHITDVALQADKDNPDIVSDTVLATTAWVSAKFSNIEDRFLRKDQDDHTPYSLSIGGKTTAGGGLQIGLEYIPGTSGWGGHIDSYGNAELHSLILRSFLETPELRYNRITAYLGDTFFSVSAGIVESVSPSADGSPTGTLTLKLESGEFGTLEAHDLVKMIFSDMENPENNATEDSDDGMGNRQVKGFATVYFEVVSVSGSRNEIIAYKLRDTSASNPRQVHPFPMGRFVQQGNRSNKARQSFIIQGVYPKPYTRMMKNVNDWVWNSDMIGMQFGYLGNVSINGTNLSGYSLYADNIYYKNFSFQLTEQLKVELSAYSINLSSYVGSVRVDSEGNIVKVEQQLLNVVSSDGNVVTEGRNVTTGEYLLQTQIQVSKGDKVLAYTSDAPGEGFFAAAISPVGCTAVVANGVVCITDITNLSDAEQCYVDIDVNCEGSDVTRSLRYQVNVIKDGSSALYADIDNEMDSVACDEQGRVLFGLPVSCGVSAWYGQRQLPLQDIQLDVPSGVTAHADASTGRVVVSEITTEAPDVMLIGIIIGVELFGVTETRSLTFTVNKVKQGQSALLYKLLPSVGSVKVNDAGIPDVSQVSCHVLMVNAQGSVQLDTLDGTDLSMQYRINNGFFVDYDYGTSLTVTPDVQSLSFRLYQDGILVDAETIPVVKDGNAIKQVGEFYLATSYGYGKGVTREDGPWGTWVSGAIPELSKEKPYLWNYEVISYTGIDATYTEPTIIAWWTQDGKGIKDIIEWYQVNNDKDHVPSYPHVEGDKWVSVTAPVMTEEAKYLWNYEEIRWTDGSVTYTEPAMIGAKGETGATTPVLSISHAAITRNSLGVFDPASVAVTASRGNETVKMWISMYGIKYTESGEKQAIFMEYQAASKWIVNLLRLAQAVDEHGITSLEFHAYAYTDGDDTGITDYDIPSLASVGASFVRDGEIGEHGPMPRNRGKYDGSTYYYYNSEYRDYVWDGQGKVFLRKTRGVTDVMGKHEAVEGAIIGFQPTVDENDPYWIPASVEALTAINTALIDNADIAGFKFKDNLMVSQDFHYNTPDGNLDATIILDGKTGYFKCNDAEVKGLITVDNIEYDVQYESDGALVQSAMVIGPGEFTLPLIREGYTIEIKAIYPTVESRSVKPPFKFGHSQPDTDSILFYDETSRWWKYYSVVELEPNILYTFVSYNDHDEYRWMLTTSTGEGSPGNAPIIDSELNIQSTNPVQNKVVTGEFNRIGPVVYNASKKYWKLDGDLLITGGVTMYGNDSEFVPSTIMDAIQVDWQTLVIENKTLKVNPNIKLGGASNWNEIEGKPTFAAVATSGKYSDLTDAPTKLSVFTNDAGYITNAITATSSAGLSIDYSERLPYIKFTKNGVTGGFVGGGTDGGIFIQAGSSSDDEYSSLKVYRDGSLVLNYSGTSYDVLTDKNAADKTVGKANLLATSRKLWGRSFNGSADVSGNMDGVGSINSALKILSGDDTAFVYNVAGHKVIFGGTGYANQAYYFRPMYGSTKGVTTYAEMYIQNMTTDSEGTSTATTTHSFKNDGSAYHKGKLTINGVEISNTKNDVLYIDANVVVRGGLTLYGTNATTAPSILDSLPIASTSSKGIAQFSSSYFTVSGGVVSIKEDSVGLNESELSAYLTSNKYLTQTSGDTRYVTELGTNGNYLTWTKNGTANNITVPYATNADTLDSVHASGFYRSRRSTIKSSDIDTFELKNSGSYSVEYYSTSGALAHSGMLAVFGRYDSNDSGSTGSVSSIEILASNYALNSQYPLKVRLSVDGNRYTAWKSLAFTDSDITGNAASASKLSASRTISLTGYVTGSGSFDGSENLSIETTIPTRNVVINGTKYAVLAKSNATADTTGIYAPTTGGTSGYVLKANGSTSTPTWVAQSSLSVGYATTAGSADEVYINHSTSSSYLPIVMASSGSYSSTGDSPLYTISSDLFGFNPNSKTIRVGTGIQIRTASNSAAGAIATSSNNLVVANSVTSGSIAFQTVDSSGTSATRVVINSAGHFYPNVGASYKLGAWGYQWSYAYINAISSGSASSNLWLMGGASIKFALLTSNGTTSNATTLGTWTTSGLVVNAGITMYSDIRKKTKLADVELSLKQIADAPLIEHYYNSDETKTTHVGSVAQYWAGMNDWFCKLDNEGFYTMELQNVALASAISVARHLQRYETKTDKTIRQLKKRISQLEDEIELLKKGESSCQN